VVPGRAGRADRLGGRDRPRRGVADVACVPEQRTGRVDQHGGGLMRRPGRSRAVVAATAVAALLALTGCSTAGEQVRDYVSENYERVSDNGPYAAFRSDDSVDKIAEDIQAAAAPGRDHQDTTGRYLGYEDVMVHIEEEQNGS